MEIRKIKKMLFITVCGLAVGFSLTQAKLAAAQNQQATVSQRAGSTWVHSEDDRWWYRHGDGSYTTAGWEKIDGKWYFFDTQGWMTTGWQRWHGNWYYLQKSGAMTTGWQKWNQNWYYLQDDGSMKVGWKKWRQNWYFLQDSGAMMTGRLEWNQAFYRLKDQSGEMLVDTITPEGNYVRKDGSCPVAESVITYQKEGDHPFGYRKFYRGLPTGDYIILNEKNGTVQSIQNSLTVTALQSLHTKDYEKYLEKLEAKNLREGFVRQSEPMIADQYFDTAYEKPIIQAVFSKEIRKTADSGEIVTRIYNLENGSLYKTIKEPIK